MAAPQSDPGRRWRALADLRRLAVPPARAHPALGQRVDPFDLGWSDHGAFQPVNAPAGLVQAIGVGNRQLNDVADTITVNTSLSGLTSPATLAHIHGPAPVGADAPVLFPFTGVPNAISGTIPTQAFTLTTTQIGQLEAGLFYVNVHTPNFPNGEIRGQLFRFQNRQHSACSD